MKGFSLIELLVALFILSFALLGFAELQQVSLKRSYNSYLFSVATTQLVAAKERFAYGNPASEMQLWQQENRLLLPTASGEKHNNSLLLCWWSRLANKKICLSSS